MRSISEQTWLRMSACREEDGRQQEEALQGCLIGTDTGLGSSYASRIHDAPALSFLTEDGRVRRTRPEHLLA